MLTAPSSPSPVSSESPTTPPTTLPLLWRLYLLLHDGDKQLDWAPTQTPMAEVLGLEKFGLLGATPVP